METDPISIHPITKNKKYWASQSFLDDDLKNKIKSADILIVPLENFRDTNSFAFTSETEKVYFFLKQNLPSDLLFEICAGDNYQVLALHADVKRLGVFFASNIALPVLLSLLASYIDRNYIATSTTPEPIINHTIVNQQIIVNTTINVEISEENIIAITYEGPAEGFQKHMEKTMKDLNASN